MKVFNSQILSLVFGILCILNNCECQKHKFGEALRIVTFEDSNNSVVIDHDSLNRLLMNSEVIDRKIVVVSIVGAFRKGKSFFLDYCLRFMYANYKSVNFMHNPLNESSNWMGEINAPLTGFSWRRGSQRETSGILIWSDVFLHKSVDGEKLAIILIDTQGLFDTETSPADNSKIFAMGTLISSVQIYNLNDVIQENQLQYLQLATDFAKFAARDSHDNNLTPFQNLLFLIRDWNLPDEFQFGIEGGNNYLKKVMKIKDEQNPELKSVREYIHSSFERINCCLMPGPGKKVIRNQSYDGRWSEMDDDFRIELVKVIQWLLKPENLKVKKIDGKKLKSSELKDYMEAYFKIFQSPDAPQGQSIYKITVDKQMNILIAKCLSTYKKNIAKNQDYSRSNFDESLKTSHTLCKSYAMTEFKNTRKMGSKDDEKVYSQELSRQIEAVFLEWKETAMNNYRKFQEQQRRTLQAIREKEEAEQRAREALIAIQEQIRINQQKYEEDKRLQEQRYRQQLAMQEKAKQDAFNTMFTSPGSYGRKTFYVTRSLESSWDSAAALCQSYGLSFLTFDSRSEAQHFMNVAGTGIWVGFSDRSQEGTFRRVSDGQVISLPWLPGEPNNTRGDEHCVESGYNDVPCSHARKIACEKV